MVIDLKKAIDQAIQSLGEPDPFLLPLIIGVEELMESNEPTLKVEDSQGNEIISTQTYYPSISKDWIPLIVRRINEGPAKDKSLEISDRLVMRLVTNMGLPINPRHDNEIQQLIRVYQSYRGLVLEKENIQS